MLALRSNSGRIPGSYLLLLDADSSYGLRVASRLASFSSGVVFSVVVESERGRVFHETISRIKYARPLCGIPLATTGRCLVAVLEKTASILTSRLCTMISGLVAMHLRWCSSAARSVEEWRRDEIYA